jgi:hypothetical protein
MNINEVIFHSISTTMLIGICITFYTAGYWNLKFLKLMSPDVACIRILYTINCFIVATVYTYVLFTYFLGIGMEYSLTAGLLIRPSLFLFGCTTVGIAKRRFCIAKREIKALNHIEEAVERI